MALVEPAKLGPLDFADGTELELNKPGWDIPVWLVGMLPVGS